MEPTEKQQLRELLLEVREERERHHKALDRLERQLHLMLGDLKPRPRLTEFVSPTGKVSKIRYGKKL